MFEKKRNVGRWSFERYEGIGASLVQIDKYLADCKYWLDMYRGDYYYLGEGKTSLGLAAVIAGELARTAVTEAQIRVKGSRCAKEALDKIAPKLRTITELALAGGGVALRCSCKDGKIHVSVFDSEHFVPLCRDEDGNITSAMFITEKEKFDGDGTAFYSGYGRIRTYRMYENYVKDGDSWKIARQFSLLERGCENPVSVLADRNESGNIAADVPEWAELEPITILQGAKVAPFVYMPINDGYFRKSGFEAGGSIYCRAVGLMREADMQFNRLIWEFEGGELAVDASEDMFRRTRRGLELPAGKERLFRTNLMSSTECEPMRVFSPALRDESIANGLDIILSRIEDCVGLSRGTLSTLRYTDRTATEIKDSKQRLYVTVCDLQKGIRKAVEGLGEAACECGRINGIIPEGKPEIDVYFGDSVVEDASVERVRDAEEFNAGLITREEFRKKWSVGN